MQLEDLNIDIQSLSPDSEEFLRLLMAWGEEIEQIFPDFSPDDIDFASVCLLKVNAEPAGIFVYQTKGEQAHVEVDYLLPKFRNLGIGKQFFDDTLEIFKTKGFELIVTSTENQVHIDYITELGFVRSKRHNSRFELQLN